MMAAALIRMSLFIAETTLGLRTKILKMACGQILTSGASIHGAVLLFVIRISAVKAMASFNVCGGGGCRARGDAVNKRY